MGHVVTIGLDLAKSVFQVHGVDRGGRGRCAALDQAVAAASVFRQTA